MAPRVEHVDGSMAHGCSGADLRFDSRWFAQQAMMAGSWSPGCGQALTLGWRWRMRPSVSAHPSFLPYEKTPYKKTSYEKTMGPLAALRASQGGLSTSQGYLAIMVGWERVCSGQPDLGADDLHHVVSDQHGPARR
jgi:hypothetical protein